MKLFILCLSLLNILGASFAAQEEDPNSGVQQSRPIVVGGKRPITDEQRLNELSQALRTHLRRLDGQANGGNLELIQLHSGTSQVVAGTLYNLFAEMNENNAPANCTISLWEKPWENFVKLDIECGEEGRKYAWNSSQIGGLGGLGGFQDMTVAGLSRLFPQVTEAFNQLSSQHNDFDVILEHINSGKYQVVAGTRYILSVEAAQQANGNPQQCEVDITENLKGQIVQVNVKCQHHDKTFSYSRQ